LCPVFKNWPRILWSLFHQDTSVMTKNIPSLLVMIRYLRFQLLICRDYLIKKRWILNWAASISLAKHGVSSRYILYTHFHFLGFFFLYRNLTEVVKIVVVFMNGQTFFRVIRERSKNRKNIWTREVIIETGILINLHIPL